MDLVHCRGKNTKFLAQTALRPALIGRCGVILPVVVVLVLATTSCNNQIYGPTIIVIT